MVLHAVIKGDDYLFISSEYQEGGDNTGVLIRETVEIMREEEINERSRTQEK